MGFSQLLLSPDHGSDVVVKAFVSLLVEMNLLPLSIHANNFKNSVY